MGYLHDNTSGYGGRNAHASSSTSSDLFSEKFGLKQLER